MLSPTAPNHLALLLARAGEQYRAFVVNADASEAGAVFDLPRMNQ